MGLLKNIIKAATGIYEAEFHVAGVTFKNGRKTRQAILRALKFKDEPYDKEVTITLEQYDYEGKPAIGVYVNGEQVGNVPADKSQEIVSHWKQQYQICGYKVIGGGSDKSYGMIVHAIFK